MKKNYARYLAGVITESQYYDLLEGTTNIGSKDKVRKAVTSIQNYWNKPGNALTKIQNILFDYGFRLRDSPSFSVHDRTPSHRETFALEKLKDPTRPDAGADPIANDLYFRWHWISDEKVEVTAYIT